MLLGVSIVGKFWLEEFFCCRGFMLKELFVVWSFFDA